MSNSSMIRLQETKYSDPIVVYQHWSNGVVADVKEMLAAAEPRWGDSTYCNRLAIGSILSKATDPILGIGIGTTDVAVDAEVIPTIVWDYKIVVFECKALKADFWLNFSSVMAMQDTDMTIEAFEAILAELAQEID